MIEVWWDRPRRQDAQDPGGRGGSRWPRGSSVALGRHRRSSRPPRQGDERPPEPPTGADDPAESLGPIVIGKGEPRPFEPRQVDVAKYMTWPFTPDTILDGWGTGFLTLRGASIRGGSHRWEGAPRQDSFAAAFAPGKNWVVVAVADGVSAAPQSHIGAAVAVDSAVEHLVNVKVADAGRVDWRRVCDTVAERLRLAAGSLKRFESLRGVIGETDSDLAEAALKHLATTLVCAVITENPGAGGLLARVVSVGDSGVWLLSDGEFRAAAGGKDDSSGITSNDVTPLPLVPSRVEPVEVAVKPGEVLLLGTDGFGEPLGSGDGELGRLFKSVLEPVPSAVKFANALDFTRKYFVDDRTLVAIWPGQGPNER